MVTQGGAGQGNGSDVSQCNVGLGLAKACWRNMRPTCPGSLIGATNTPSFNVPGRGHYLTWAHSFLLYQPKTIADPDWPITPSPPLGQSPWESGPGCPPLGGSPPTCNVTSRNFLSAICIPARASYCACTRPTSCLTL